MDARLPRPARPARPPVRHRPPVAQPSVVAAFCCGAWRFSRAEAALQGLIAGGGCNIASLLCGAAGAAFIDALLRAEPGAAGGADTPASQLRDAVTVVCDLVASGHVGAAEGFATLLDPMAFSPRALVAAIGAAAAAAPDARLASVWRDLHSASPAMAWGQLAGLARAEPSAEAFLRRHCGAALAAQGWVLLPLTPGASLLTAPPGSVLHGRLVTSLVHAVRRARASVQCHQRACARTRDLHHRPAARTLVATNPPPPAGARCRW